MVRALFSVRMVAVMCAASLWLVDFGQLEAGQMQYTATSQGTITGTLNGTAFTDKTFSMTQTGDTSNILYGVFYSGGIEYDMYSLPGTVSITIDGVGTATFTSPTDMRAFSGNIVIPGVGSVAEYAGFADFSTVGSVGVATSAVNVSTYPTFYDLSSPFSVNQNNHMRRQTYNTSSGDLVVTGSTDDLITFTAAAVAVPEPSSLALGAVGAGLALLAARRRRS